MSCQPIQNFYCSHGKIYDSTTQSCIDASKHCPDGQIHDGTSCKLLEVAGYCKDGEVFSQQTQSCVSLSEKCPQGQVMKDGVCNTMQTLGYCQSGFVHNGSECISLESAGYCSEGKVFSQLQNACIDVANQCPEGQVLENGACKTMETMGYCGAGNIYVPADGLVVNITSENCLAEAHKHPILGAQAAASVVQGLVVKNDDIAPKGCGINHTDMSVVWSVSGTSGHKPQYTDVQLGNNYNVSETECGVGNVVIDTVESCQQIAGKLNVAFKGSVDEAASVSKCYYVPNSGIYFNSNTTVGDTSAVAGQQRVCQREPPYTANPTYEELDKNPDGSVNNSGKHKNYYEFLGHCTAQGKRLCDMEDLCTSDQPDAQYTVPELQNKTRIDAWLPVGNRRNDWIWSGTGSHLPPNLDPNNDLWWMQDMGQTKCKNYGQMREYGKWHQQFPNWGEDHGAPHIKGEVFCCDVNKKIDDNLKQCLLLQQKNQTIPGFTWGSADGTDQNLWSNIYECEKRSEIHQSGSIIHKNNSLGVNDKIHNPFLALVA